MSQSTFPSFAIPAGGRWLADRPLAPNIVSVLRGTLVLAAASQVAVPMIPVPMTMQTFAVTLIGAFFGWRLGALTVLAWLAEAALGLPVLANGSGSLASFMGPTAGYLVAFPLMAALTGWLAERGWNGSKVLLAFASMLMANALCLAIGGAYLAVLIGAEKALMLGVVPFIFGGVLKSILAAALMKALHRSPQA
ncbi:biotin transporter BioY [soil metagenome]